MHTHADLKLTDELYAKPILGITENDVCYSVAKLFFAYGLGNALTFPMSAGATTVLLPAAADAGGGGATFSRSTASPCSMPCRRFMPRFSRAPRRRDARSSSCARCVSAGEALPADVGRRWSERFGVDILDGIGSTEMLHIFLSNRAGEVKYGTTGKPVPGYDIRLVDDDGQVVTRAARWANCRCAGRPAPSCTGTTASNRARPSSASGRAPATNTSRTSDGYFVYCGRADDMLKVGGIYVSPFEVEAALQSHPDVLEAAVVGWPDERRLIKPKAFVVLKAPEKAGDALARALQDHCRAKLAAYKYPRWIEFRSRIAEDRDRQDPALQAARRGRGAVMIDPHHHGCMAKE